jgi:hypothetical protein
MERKKNKLKFFNDILKERGKYSQGRIYLLLSVVAYYLTLAILTIAGIRKDEIEMENFRMIVDALEYAMALFAGYAFGGKAVDVANTLLNRNGNKPPVDEDEELG